MDNMIFVLVWAHFFADFVLQSDRMALSKSKSFVWLGAHVGVYTLALTPLGLWFALVNGATHFVVDAITSRINANRWTAEKRGWFFNCIGLDQAIHLTILIWSAKYFGVV